MNFRARYPVALHLSTPAFFTLCLALALLPTTGLPLAAEGGTITGRVLDPAGSPLPGAAVEVMGTNLATSTGVNGNYRLSPVPAGTWTLQVSYLGFEPQTAELEISSGQTLRREVTLAPYGELLIVRATPGLPGPIVEEQAKALNHQTNAVNILNVVAADQIGRFPDANAAEAMQRLPGITLQRDQGEGRYALVRGTEARLNSTAINGERIPSPSGSGREVPLDVIPADLLAAIEVAKSLTPDMDGDAIGGAVNLVTRHAPESPRFLATLAGGHNDIVDDDISSGNFTYGRRFDDNRLGLLLSGSALETNRGSHNFEVEYDAGSLDNFELRDYVIERQRFGATAALDHRLSERSDLFLHGIWNRFDDQEFRRRKRNRVAAGSIERDLKDRYESQEITMLSGGGSHLLGGSASLDYRLTWSSANEDEPDRIDSVFVQEDVSFAPNVGPGGIDPDNIRANPLNESLDQFLLEEVVREENFVDTRDLVASVDLTLPFYRDQDFSGLWKTGAKLRFEDKNRDRNTVVFEPENDILLRDLVDNYQPATPFLDGRYVLGRHVNPRQPRQLIERFGLEGERDLEGDLADYQAEEDTLAGYGLAQLHLGDRLTVLGGVRYEHTDTSYRAFELVFDEEGDLASLTPMNGGKHYGQLLPMVHFRYRLSPSLGGARGGGQSTLRAALTRTLSRPRFEDLAPFELILEEDAEIERGNPELDVTTSWNLDLLYERTFQPLGLLAAGVFYKRLSDNVFVFTFEQTRGGDVFDVIQPRNGERAELLGFELAFQNQLRSLPAPFDALGLYFNYTYTDSEASFSNRPGSRLPGQAANVGNLALSYERDGFSGRVSLNYHGDYLAEVADSPAEDIFVDDHLQLDLSLRQRLNDKMSVFIEVLNLTDEPFRVYQGSPDRPVQEEYYKWSGTIGLKLDF